MVYIISLQIYMFLIYFQSYACFPINSVHFRKRIHSTTSSRLHNGEQKLRLEIGIDSCAFLNNINEYGNARMARRAVGILQKMPAYFVKPTIEHYNAAILACEKSNQFQMAMSVFDEMRDIGMRPTVDTYAYLISCADKCKKFDECLEIFRMCREDSSVKLNTEIYNNVMWVAEMADNASLVLELLREMETNSIQRDHQTYSAATNACERNGDGETALHVLDLMTSEGIVLTPGVGQAVVWSCVKSGMWKEALEIFDIMGEVGVKREAFCYSGAIWACEQSGDWERAVELLRRMKVDKNFKRDTISFDGAISALCKAGKWEKARELMTWMDRDQVPKSDVTYRNVLGVLYDAEQMEVLEEIYLLALREEMYCPWVTGTRIVDVSYMPLALVYCAMKSVLDQFKNGKMAPFDLTIIFSDVRHHGEGHTFTTMESMIKLFDDQKCLRLLEVDNDDGKRKVLIKRELLLTYCADKCAVE